MKHFILSLSIIFLSIAASGQNVVIQVDQLDVALQSQGDVLMVSTLGEPVVGVDVSQGIAVISGFYPVSFFEETSGVNNLPLEGLEAWPNPVQSVLILRCSSTDRSDYEINVFDAKGALMDHQSWELKHSRFELAFNSHPPGMYSVEVYEPGSGKRSTVHVLKQ
ncbi:MAG TPA: T9SS type A sorting domain-containing protein [Saprospiraceae bacterium]|nr:T9SS type A sorting domain-containing protein [Saprospiraceae bacterium]